MTNYYFKKNYYYFPFQVQRPTSRSLGPWHSHLSQSFQWLDQPEAHWATTIFFENGQIRAEIQPVLDLYEQLKL